MVVFISLIVAVFLPIVQCAAAPVAPIVYVAGDGTGDFNCDGTADNVEINQALQYVASNEGFTTVYLKGPFEYDIAASLLIDSNTTLEGDSTAVLKQSAAADVIKAISTGRTDITIRSFSIETGNFGAHAISLGASWKNITINDMKINGNMGNKKFAIVINPGSMPSESANVRIFNNTITDFAYGAIDLGNIDGVEVYSNDFVGADTLYPLIMRISQVNNLKIYDNTMRMLSVGAIGIQINHSVASNINVNSIEIYNNQFIDIISAGIALNAIDGEGTGKAENVHIHHNVFRNNGRASTAFGGGVTVNGFDNTLIEHNIFDACKSAAIKSYKISAAPTPAEPYVAYVRNNIIVNTLSRSTTAGTGNAVFNNLSATHTFVIDNNLVYNNEGEDYVNATANSSISADPLFADPVNFDYHLKSTAGRWDGTTWVVDTEHSPCIDAGYPTSDFANEPADNGERVNIGLYGNTQYASKSVRQLAVSDPATNGAFVGGTYQVAVSAGEYLDATASVDLYVDNVKAATVAAAPYTFDWDTSALAEGSYALSAVGQLQQVGGPAYSLVRSVTVDNTAPAATITDPGVVPVSGTYNITATASDTNGIKEVQFLLDGTLLGTDNSTPYAYSWDTTAASDGTHTITARAVDMAGNTTDSSATIRVNNSGAIFFIESPTDQSLVSGSVPITVTATGSGTITKVEFKVSETVLGEDTEAPYTYTWDTTALADGSYTITVNVTDDFSVVTSQSITVTVDNTAPTLQIAAPANGATVKDTVAISATANDSNGIASVNFKVASLDVTDTAAPYSVNWDTTQLDNGNYSITITASDTAGNATNASITVTTDNVFPTTDAIGHGPNPASSSVTFYFNGVSGTLRVYDISGRLVWSKPVPVSSSTMQIAWDLKNLAGKTLANGLYFYLVVDSDGKASAPLQLVIAR
jgi:hypothetical protein